MDAEIKRKWVEALRSGDYKQTQAILRDGDAFCCLGVLCDLVASDVGGTWSESGRFITPGDDRSGMPPFEVRNIAALPDVKADEVAEMNDDGKSFAEIADYIEANL